ncbi:MAG: helix-turn-helix transcriptional regulator [Bacteroidota bacterium]
MSGRDIYHIILLLGALQGIILGISLWRGKFPRQKANKWLSVLLLFFAYRLIAEVLASVGIINYGSWLYHVFLEYNWIYGTLVFFYIKNYIDASFQLQKSDWIHFLPVGTEFLFSNYVKVQNFYWDGTRESLSWLGAQAYILWMHMPFQLLVAGSLILFYIYQSKKYLAEYTTQNTQPVQVEDVDWLQLILKIYSVFALLVMTIGSVDYLFFNYAFNPFYQFPTFIGLAIITYWLGLQGFARRNLPILATPKAQKEYDIAAFQSILNQLENAMETEKLYRNPQLTLAELANHLAIKPYQLTQVLNRALQKSFTDYVNEYRVKEVAKIINNPQYSHYTLLALAYQVGFNSKASFNRIVKKTTGQSPKFLRKSPKSPIKTF